jgi:hypothetical protein
MDEKSIPSVPRLSLFGATTAVTVTKTTFPNEAGVRFSSFEGLQWNEELQSEPICLTSPYWRALLRI